jgi:hypothetical protein
MRLELYAGKLARTGLREGGRGNMALLTRHQAPDVAGKPGTASFFVVLDRLHGWSWRCFSPNCPQSWGPMRHSFELLQRLLGLTVRSAILEACVRWCGSSRLRRSSSRSRPGRHVDPRVGSRPPRSNGMPAGRVGTAAISGGGMGRSCRALRRLNVIRCGTSHCSTTSWGTHLLKEAPCDCCACPCHGDLQERTASRKRLSPESARVRLEEVPPGGRARAARGLPSDRSAG